MATLGQFRYSGQSNISFATAQPNLQCERQNFSNSTANNIQDLNTGMQFVNETVFFKNGDKKSTFSEGTAYYYYGKVRMLTNEQIFNVKLVGYRTNATQATVQYITTIRVPALLEARKDDSIEWFPIDFVFTPLASQVFTDLLFELQRTAEDYRTEIYLNESGVEIKREEKCRYPLFIHYEISVIENPFLGGSNGITEFLKIGVQSAPGLLMCINNEEIRVGRSGIYELRNGVITITQFSVLAPVDNHDAVTTAEETLKEDIKTNAPKDIDSLVLDLPTTQTRNVNRFFLDYMY